MTEPLVALPEPAVEKPLPVQDVVLVEDHESVAEPPEVIEVGEAVRLTDGAFMTVTVALPKAVIEPPLHEIEYVVVTVGLTVTEPLVAPPEPPGDALPPAVEKPLPVHEVALVEDQVSVAELPEVIEVGEAVRVTDGLAGGLETVPPVVAGVTVIVALLTTLTLPFVHETE